MATLEQLEARIAALESVINRFDPAKFASKDEFDKTDLKLTEIENFLRNFEPGPPRWEFDNLVEDVMGLHSWILQVELEAYTARNLVNKLQEDVETLKAETEADVDTLQDDVALLKAASDVTAIYKLPYTGAEFGAKLAKI